MQNFGVTNKEYYGMLWYFLEWSIMSACKTTFTLGALEQWPSTVIPFYAVSQSLVLVRQEV